MDNGALAWLIVAMVAIAFLLAAYHDYHSMPAEIHVIYCQGTRCEYV